MTTIITRLFSDVATAQAAVAALKANRQDPATMEIITREGAGQTIDRLRAARVPAASATAYAAGISDGRALLVVRAPFAPMGTARNAIRVVNRFPALSVGLADEDVYIREQPRLEASGKVMQGKVFFMSNPYRSISHGHILGSNPVSQSKPRTSAIRGGAYMSTKFWPMRLLSRPKEGTSAIRGGFLFSSMFGLPTIIHDWGPREMMTKI
jgi:hypothetical protein